MVLQKVSPVAVRWYGGQLIVLQSFPVAVRWNGGQQELPSSPNDQMLQVLSKLSESSDSSLHRSAIAPWTLS